MNTDYSPAATDLALFAINDGALYTNCTKPILYTMAAMAVSGNYTTQAGLTALMRIVEAARREYRRQHPGVRKVFSRDDMRATADYLLGHYSGQIAEIAAELSRVRVAAALAHRRAQPAPHEAH